MPDKMRIQWQSSPASMAERVDRYKKNLLEAVYRLAEEWAARIAADAKANHRWTNRTGDAERGLAGRTFRLAAGALIVISHGVFYGIYLERRWGGKYAGLVPALERAYGPVLDSLQALVR